MATTASSEPTPAEAYEHYQVPALFEPFARELIARAVPQPGEHVLDLACGTATTLAARKGGDATILPGSLQVCVDDVVAKRV